MSWTLKKKFKRIVSHELYESSLLRKSTLTLRKPNQNKNNFGKVSLLLLADLKAQTAAIETGFVHGTVLLHKLAAQVSCRVLQRVQLAVVVVIDQLLGEVKQGTQLTQSAAVCFHLRDIVVCPEEGSVVVRGNVTALVNDVQKAGLQDLKGRKKEKEGESVVKRRGFYLYSCF